MVVIDTTSNHFTLNEHVDVKKRTVLRLAMQGQVNYLGT